MGLQDLQLYIEENCPKAPVRVELGKVAWRKRGGQNASKFRNQIPGHVAPLFVVVDVESCIHRLYGGSFTDWVCGGQWMQMLQFIHTFTMSARHQNIELVFFFNGCTEKHRLQDWSKDQLILKSNIRNIISHTQRKGTPPPRAWFVPPVALEQCLRLALIDCGVPIAQSKKDHHREIMAYCRGNVFHGILGHSADYIVFDPPRYFSSHTLKLSRDSRIITSTQFLVEELTKHLDLPTSAMPILGTLLGNHILLEEDVAAFQWRLVDPKKAESKLKANRLLLPSGSELIPEIAKYLKEKPDPIDLDEIAKDVFSSNTMNLEDKIKRLKESVNYYRSATRNGGRSSAVQSQNKSSKDKTKADTNSVKQEKPDDTNVNKNEKDKKDQFLDDEEDIISDLSNALRKTSINEPVPEAMDISATESEKGTTNGMSPLMHTTVRPYSNIPTPPLPNVSQEVMRIAHHRHAAGQMHPYVYQILSTGEIKLAVCMEDEQNPTLPSVAAFYRIVRQHIYGILFSVGEAHHQKKTYIKEWWATKGKALWTPELVEAIPFSDWKVPSLQKLWLGREPEDKNRRMRAFLSCLRSDTPSMLNQRLVPPRVLMLACILRYITHTAPILRKQEVDAFLATAMSPVFANPPAQDLEAPELTVRGILISGLFMKGVEIGIFANDVCGSPIPALLAAPWNYFDGRVFQRKLSIANQEGTNLVQICEGHVESVARVERLRQAILEGCPFPFAKNPYPLPPFQQMPQQNLLPQPPFISPRGMGNKPPHYPPPHPPYGQNYAQLKVAGFTVGNWAGGDNPDMFMQNPSLGGYQSFESPLGSARIPKGPPNRNTRHHGPGGYDHSRHPERGRSSMAYRGGGDNYLSLEAQNMRPFYLD